MDLIDDRSSVQDVTAGIVPNFGDSDNINAESGDAFDQDGQQDQQQQMPLDIQSLLGAEKLNKLKRGLWFIIRGQKINSMDGIAEFFEQVKEEMARQQLRDESSKAGGTSTLVENMMTSFQSSVHYGSAPSSAFSSSANLFGGGNNTTVVSASTAPSSGSKGNSAAAQNPLTGMNGEAMDSASRVEQKIREQTGDDNIGQFSTSTSVGLDPNLLPSNQEVNRDLRRREEENGAFPMKNNNSTTSSSGGKLGTVRSPKQQQQQQAANTNSVILGGLTFEEAKNSDRLRPRVMLKSIPETEEQMEQSRITDFIETWSDTVSLIIIISQLFVLYSVCFRAGFSVPVTATSIVFDKIFADLVAIASIVYRCVAPFKEHGRWHFDKRTRFVKYLCSGALLIDVVGVFPLDLVGYGLGYHCAVFRPSECGLVDGLFQLNRLLQCRGMLGNFGAVAETLFLRRGLHPILGRCAEVLLTLICLTHIVSCSWFFQLSRNDRSDMYDYYGDGFDHKPLDFQYFMVVDWSAKSLVGLSPSGSNYPPKSLDQAYLIILTIVGVAIFTNYIATIKLYFDRDCPEKSHFQLLDETIDMVNYMELDEGFRDDCLAYFNHMFQARFHVSGMKDFEDDLTQGLARKMRFVVGRELVQHIPLLKSLQSNEPFIVSLMQRIEPLVLPPNTTIFKRDDSGSTMLVLIKGFVNILSPKDDATVVATLGPGKVVGEVALLMDSPRTATVVSCSEFLNVLSLDRRQMSELIMLFPEIAPILMAEMATRMHQLNQQKQKQQQHQQQQGK